VRFYTGCNWIINYRSNSLRSNRWINSSKKGTFSSSTRLSFDRRTTTKL